MSDNLNEIRSGDSGFGLFGEEGNSKRRRGAMKAQDERSNLDVIIELEAEVVGELGAFYRRYQPANDAEKRVVEEAALNNVRRRRVNRSERAILAGLLREVQRT